MAYHSNGNLINVNFFYSNSHHLELCDLIQLNYNLSELPFLMKKGGLIFAHLSASLLVPPVPALSTSRHWALCVAGTQIVPKAVGQVFLYCLS